MAESTARRVVATDVALRNLRLTQPPLQQVGAPSGRALPDLTTRYFLPARV